MTAGLAIFTAIQAYASTLDGRTEVASLAIYCYRDKFCRRSVRSLLVFASLVIYNHSPHASCDTFDAKAEKYESNVDRTIVNRVPFRRKR